MGNIDLVPVFLGAVVFFAIGVVWYSVLFGKAWQRATGLSDEQLKSANIGLIYALAFLFELLIAVTLAHQYAMTGPGDRAKMMIAIGYGAMLMTPAIGIHYLFQRRSGVLFAIDAGYFIVGMAAMGGVFVAWG